jgi:hypothetical protein
MDPEHGQAGLVGAVVGNPEVVRVRGGLADLVGSGGEVDIDDRVVQRAGGTR